MTCRHAWNDPACSSYAARVEQARQLVSPDADRFEIVEVEEVGRHLVLKVLYPNCEKCSYEGNKVMVFLNTTAAQALKWKTIDPHFREPSRSDTRDAKAAPGPAVRFPASDDGWADAIDYAKRKGES